MTRFLVLLFMVLVVGAAVVVGRMVMGEAASPLGGGLATLTDPGAPVAQDDSSRQTVIVTSGETAAAIGDDLQARGLVRSALYFRFLVDQAGVGAQLAAGPYELSPSMSTQAILQILSHGEVKKGIQATIPEGWQSRQIADRLEQTGFASGAEFLRAVTDPPSVPNVSILGTPPPGSLEGYLFPQTYTVAERTSGTHAAELMIDMFDRTAMNQLLSDAAGSRLSPHQIVTLASIVEREAKLPSERSLIAGVYANRLAAGMLLQADPTVQFALALRDGAEAASYSYWKSGLTTADLAVPSPYNTYVNKGLPRGPICNPGLPSLQAALHPAQTDYLYFVANGDGSHLFARTLDEHNQNVQKAGP